MNPTARADVRWTAIVAGTLAAGVGLLLWAGRDTLYTVDDLVWFMGSPSLDLDGALRPHNGHLILIPRVIYAAVLETFGSGYGPIRLLTALAAAGTAALLYAWAARRVGRVAALAAAAAVLTLGTSYVFLIAGDGLMLQLSIACGLGALLALERRDRRGDALACGLLCLGVLTYSAALPFVVAGGVSILLARDRRRLRIVAAPVAIYGAWWLWALGEPADSATQVQLSNLLTLPAYAFQALSSALGALTGLDHDFSGAAPVRPEFDSTDPVAGPALAVAAIAAFAWSLRRRPTPAAVWVAAALPLTLWVMGGLTVDAASPPDATRFVLPFSLAIICVAAAAARRPPARGALIAIWAVAACGIAANVDALAEGGNFRRDVDAPQLRAELAAFDLAGETAVELPDLSEVSDTGPVLFFPFSGFPIPDPVSSYHEAAARYGALGFTPEELATGSEELRARTDATLVAARATALEPHTGPPGDCERLSADPGAPLRFDLPPGGAVLEAAVAGEVSVQRFADSAAAAVGALVPGEPAAIRIPADGASEPWTVLAAVDSALVCAL